LRVIVRFLSAGPDGFGVFLTPTMSERPARVGEIASSDGESFRTLRRGGRTVAYAGVVANIAGNPAMSVPLHWNHEDIPIGVCFLGRSAMKHRT
jgi:amidase